MSILIIILSIIGSIIALFLIIAAFVKKDFSYQREIIISRSVPDVFAYVRRLKNQEHYSVWVMRDPAVKLVYTGTDGEVGATSAWESKDKHVGVGEQEIKKIIENQSLEMEIRFKKPFQDTNNARTTVEAVEGGTRVTNCFYGTNAYPRNIMNLVMEKMVGKDLQQNLVNLKQELEKK
ncbi:MAG: SRPBCC family protein [Bacteroidetes bacterium]|nr:SRPBCC family protein [Bacteroidota bacterium]